jgi:hypothetical protein
VTAGGTTRVIDLTDAWSAPSQLDSHLWLTRPPDYDLGVVSAGDSVTVSETITFDHPLLLVYPPVTSSGDNGPSWDTGEGPFSCTITAG